MFVIKVLAEGQDPQELDFDQEEVAIGRSSASDIPLAASNVSKQHSRIVRREGKHFIIDRKSTNGTYVNGTRVTAPQVLQDGDKIFIGDFTLGFKVMEKVEDDAAAVPPPLPTQNPSRSEVGPLPQTEVDVPPPPPIVEDPLPLDPPEQAQEEPPEIPEVEQPEIAQTPLGGDVEDQQIPLRERLFETVLQFDEFTRQEHILDYRLDDQAFTDGIQAKLLGEIENIPDLTVGSAEKQAAAESVVRELLGYGPLESLLENTEIREIFCNGPHRIVTRTFEGKKDFLDQGFSCEEALLLVLDRLLAEDMHFELDDETSLVDVTLPSGLNVTAVFSPFSVHGTSVRITRPPEQIKKLDHWVEDGVINQDTAEFLRATIAERKTILVAGRDGTDRVCFLNMLAQEIPLEERVVALETAGSIKLPQRDSIVLSDRAGNHSDPFSLLSVADLIRQAIRLEPDRMVVADVKDDDALELLQAINGGIEGALFSIYGVTVQDALRRLEHMIVAQGMGIGMEAVRDMIAGNVNLVVLLQRDPESDHRMIGSISAIRGHNGSAYDIEEK